MERISGVHIVPHFCRIEDKDIDFYNEFNIIALGLDSIEARSYINTVACSFLGVCCIPLGFNLHLLILLAFTCSFACCPRKGGCVSILELLLSCTGCFYIANSNIYHSIRFALVSWPKDFHSAQVHL